MNREGESHTETQHAKAQVTETDSDTVLGGGSQPSVTSGKTRTPSQSEIFLPNNRVYLKSHCRISTPSQSKISGKLPKCHYYKPHKDQETYHINSEGHLQCHQDEQKTIKVSNPQELPGSKDNPIYIVPGSVIINSVDDLIRLYPNSFDMLGSLKGEYDIKVDPSVPPVQHARRKVPIESKAAIKEAIDYMVQQDTLEPQIEPTPWVSSVTYPVKSTGEVRPCLDARDLNKAIIHENHKPQTVEDNCPSTGWSGCLHESRCLEGLPSGTPHRGKQQATGDQHSHGQVPLQENAIWSQDVTGCVSDEDGSHHGEIPRSHKHS